MTRSGSDPLPDVLGIGVQKGGTTTLHHLLQGHPEVFLPASKEVHFFSKHFAEGQQWYTEHFGDAGEQRCRAEITPYYVFHPEVPARVQALLPEVRLILLLRDPVERTLSQLFHSRRLGFEPLEPQQALAAELERLAGAEAVLARADGVHRSHQEHSYVSRSRYEQQLDRWLRHVDRERLLLLRSEDLFLDPERTWQLLQSFLNLTPLPLPEEGLPRSNSGQGEAAAIAPSLRTELRRQLAPTYEAMASLHGINWP
jgi:hypothetical protein